MKRAIYTEEGGKYLVDVLSDETKPEDGRDMRRATLRCIETLRPSPLFGAIATGGEFDVTCASGFEPEVGWSLEYV